MGLRLGLPLTIRFRSAAGPAGSPAPASARPRSLTPHELDTVAGGKGGGGDTYWHHEYEVGGIYSSQTFVT